MRDEHDTASIDQFVTYRISRVNARLNAQAARILRDVAEISLTEWRMLVVIEQFGPLSISRIVRETQFDKGLVSRTIKRLLERGLLKAEQSEQDQRTRQLSMTAEGQARFSEGAPKMRARQSVLTDPMTKAELETFFTVLDKLEGAMDRLDRLYFAPQDG